MTLDKYHGGTADPENYFGGNYLHDIAIDGSDTIDGHPPARFYS